MATAIKVVWWWDHWADLDIPRTHSIGWSQVHGGARGTVWVPRQPHTNTPSPELCAQTVAEDAGVDPLQVADISAPRTGVSLDRQMKLRQWSETVTDLSSWLDLCGGVVMAGRQPPRIVRAPLGRVRRARLIRWSLDAVLAFAAGDREGWRQTKHDHWQSLASWTSIAVVAGASAQLPPAAAASGVER